jgi:hypothetical protein
MKRKFILTPQGNKPMYNWLKDELFRLNNEIRSTNENELTSLSITNTLKLPVYDLNKKLKVMEVELYLTEDNTIILKSK